jgi:CubicO group peptidase (beta-lactamase class C family)
MARSYSHGGRLDGLAEVPGYGTADSLSTWLPDWAEKIPNGDEMTLRQLAQHTSGIWDYGDPIIGEAANNPDKLEHSTRQNVRLKNIWKCLG